MASRTKKKAATATTGLRLDLQNFVPFFLTATMNRFAASSSRIYLQTHGCGMAEWRILSMLALHPNLTASNICEYSGIDKSSVSRAVKVLTDRGCLSVNQDASDQRRAQLSLSKAGVALHDEMIKTALDHEKIMLTGFSPKERSQMILYLRRLMNNVKMIDTNPQILEKLAEEDRALARVIRTNKRRKK